MGKLRSYPLDMNLKKRKSTEVLKKRPALTKRITVEAEREHEMFWILMMNVILIEKVAPTGLRYCRTVRATLTINTLF